MISLRFSSGWPWWVVTLIGILGALLIARWYWRESRSLARPWNWLLPSLRGFVFLLLLLMLTGPVLQYRWVEGELSQVAIVVDTSRSMSVVDTGAQDATRLDRATQWLIGESARPKTSRGDSAQERSSRIESPLDTWRDSHRVQIYDLKSQLTWDSMTNRELPEQSLWKPDGTTSPIGSVLQQIYRNRTNSSETKETGTDSESAEPSNRFDAIVLLTDGQNNESLSPLDVVQQMTGPTAPIYAVGVGTEKEPDDLAILAMEVSQSVRREDRLRGSIRIKEQVAEGEKYRVVVENEGSLLFEKELVSEGKGSREVAFDVSIAETIDKLELKYRSGVERRSIPVDIRCRIESTLQEQSQSNNEFRTSTWGVVKQNQVMLLDPRGRWETRYIRNALERDPTWKIKAALGPKAFESSFFAENRLELFENDLLILTTDTIPYLLENHRAWLSDFVGNAGGGLIWIDCPRVAVEENNSIDELLPVVRRNDINRAEASVEGANRGMLMQLSNAANDQPAFQLASELSANTNLWRTLPGPHAPRWCELKPGAESLVEGKWRDGNWAPLIATGLFGQGRCVYLGTDETWRWRYNVADLHHQRFWNQLAGWTMRTPYVVRGTYVSLDAGKRVYQSDESVTVRTRIQSEDQQAFENGNVQLVLRRNGERIASYPMTEWKNSGGVYSATIDPLAKSSSISSDTTNTSSTEYTVQIEAVGISPEALDVSTSYVVIPSVDMEYSALACNSEMLRNIAKATGGEYRTLDEADDLLSLLEKHQRGRVVLTETILWQSYPWFVTIMVLLATEWYLRKRAGLV